MMKKMLMTAVLTTIVVAAQAMSFTQARQEALFLSDKMAYELRLTMDQYEAVYEINLDYFLSIQYSDDVFGVYWNRRNTDLRFVLTTWQYRRYITTVDFYQPAMWRSGSWVFSIYSRYDRGNHFRQPPTVYGTYRGGRNRGTISYYEGRTIAKPSGRHIGTGNGWNVQPQGSGNNHFSQPNNGRSTGTGNQGTRRFGTTTSGQTGTVNRSVSGGSNTQPQQKSQQSATTRPTTQSNGSGHFGGRR